jgi:hypothetical protein
MKATATALALAAACLALAPASARSAPCDDAADASLAGNRRCATPDEQKLISKMINGPWIQEACEIRFPRDWHTQRDTPQAPVRIVPNPRSFLAEQIFWANVGVTTRAQSPEEAAQQTAVEDDPPADGTEEATVADLDDEPADEPRPDNPMDFRYLTVAGDGRGEGEEEHAGVAGIVHDADHREWHVDYTIELLPPEDSSPEAPVTLTRYACGASDRMSIDVFSSVCTAVWERMMLARERPQACVQNDDDEVMDQGRTP